jgi:hypothetical protein
MPTRVAISYGEPEDDLASGEPTNALEYLQDIYKGRRVFDHHRVRAAAIAIAYESPKYAVTAFHVNDKEFGAKLERALARSGMKFIATNPTEDK